MLPEHDQALQSCAAANLRRGARPRAMDAQRPGRRRDGSGIGVMGLHHEILREGAWPRSLEVAALGRRLSAIRWHRTAGGPRDPAGRIAAAVARHAALVGLPFPATVRVLDRVEGRRQIAAGEIDLGRPRWEAALAARLDEARELILESERDRDHPLFFRSGSALLVRSGALPIDDSGLWSVLADACGPEARAAAEILLERVRWEMSAALAWELAGDLLGENPFVELLPLYEEGLFPLDFPPDPVILWAMGVESPRAPDLAQPSL